MPHHGGRAGRGRIDGGNSPGDSRAASTANGFLIPVVLAPANSANPSGVQPAANAAAMAGASFLRWAAVSSHRSLRRAIAL